MRLATTTDQNPSRASESGAPKKAAGKKDKHHNGKNKADGNAKKGNKAKGGDKAKGADKTKNGDKGKSTTEPANTAARRMAPKRNCTSGLIRFSLCGRS